jgi:hypothetical protein
MVTVALNSIFSNPRRVILDPASKSPKALPRPASDL